ncbi:thioesterase family protein [Dietzia sp. SYD-A1]|uniref:thioesterase family protein n=1 Tax=Dietzia sp. SYD-A1 TaxID=2780141 RepID=UPI001891E768|nr:thioesterase family protein [Dietzia sp. SYD-A1]
MAYFERLGGQRFRPTSHTTGAWDPAVQHIGPSFGLLVHEVERDLRRRRDDPMVLSRLTYEILGTVPMHPVAVDVQVIRPGRTIELVEASYGLEDRVGVRLRAWFQQPRDTTGLQGAGFDPIPGPSAMEQWDPTSVWQGGYLASADVRRDSVGPGRARYWVRTGVPLVAGEPVGALAGAATLFDIANGMAIRADPSDVQFPNIDLTAHLLREPRGDWVGFDTRVGFGPGGLGLTASVLHDESGPMGTLAQTLTVRPVT